MVMKESLLQRYGFDFLQLCEWTRDDHLSSVIECRRLVKYDTCLGLLHHPHQATTITVIMIMIESVRCSVPDLEDYIWINAAIVM